MDRCRIIAVAAAVWLLLPVGMFANQLRGYAESCVNEGEIVNVLTIKNMMCYTCMCKNGFVECVKDQCPDEQGCYMLQDVFVDTKECCRRCKGCVYKGVPRDSGTEWTDPNDPCMVMSCKAGVVTETRMQCITPCQQPLPPKPGTCCPTCSGCRVIGQEVAAWKNISLYDDPCLTCHCERSAAGPVLTCSKKACPVLQCPSSSMQILPGECCPRCVGKSRKLMDPPRGACLLGDKITPSGQGTHPDRCTECTCANSTVVCTRETCPPLDCPVEKQTFASHNQCCPQCPRTLDKSETCVENGNVYLNGDGWKVDECKSCLCVRGQVQCAQEMCPRISTSCPLNMKLRTVPGSCCPRCVPMDGVCTVFGDPHYRTYDGKFFSFQGPCKYLLSADCVGRTFSIRVTNDARNTRNSAWTKTISLRTGGLKVNLGENKRIKINGQRVSVPYKRSNELTISNMNDTVLVETRIGVSIIWDGRGFLEVSVPSRYKGSLCGLCGNFNSVPRDDMTTKDGQVVLEPQVFGSSWRVGGKNACSRPLKPPFVQTSTQCSKKGPRIRERMCKPLRQRMFAACHKKLNPVNFFRSCLMDMCECPTGRKCYCEAMTAYAHNCRRLGVSLPDWRTMTGCHTY
ncbi:BMP-binding endothelial regulator protein [Acyrthosiphon pisum]|uniref:BMP-binding endothelial regulator protein n=2 Tax=Acyrthosiphon pisum TaxID=7029 RepID=A0A8R1VY18_ACYPI|nr:BMP-binding endothelial regulator protein [Acyrthosiphon pisum]|eukprot:XP_001942569.2 PREDICTED: BMP-binding endothelial regulator protein [Acyrthosiphon pisum]